MGAPPNTISIRFSMFSLSRSVAIARIVTGRRSGALTITSPIASQTFHFPINQVIIL
jgi:hypothetical protein